MNHEEKFLAFIKQVRNLGFSWIVNENGEIRAKENNHEFCPLTALAYSQNNLLYEIDEPDFASQSLGIDTELERYIISAADEIYPFYSASKSMRIKMYEILFQRFAEEGYDIEDLAS